MAGEMTEYRNLSFRDFAEARKTLVKSAVWDCHYEALTIVSTKIDSTFAGCEFADISWAEDSFVHAKFVRCIFKDCKFVGADFGNAVFAGCTFEGCSLPSGACELSARISAKSMDAQ